MPPCLTEKIQRLANDSPPSLPPLLSHIPPSFLSFNFNWTTPAELLSDSCLRTRSLSVLTLNTLPVERENNSGHDIKAKQPPTRIRESAV
ncbi:hypothetical protein EYF80_017762 [Liparis tanakae]|uniref:Uncharacterized protein n=1 Tax=Liparis tanakae TaxID=230148 RepID=A0A4Z2I3T1_9TELE|nr:hypothetical protein EYF80_017762 [Liparis tanakae]